MHCFAVKSGLSRCLYGRFHRRKMFDKHEENKNKVQRFNTFIAVYVLTKCDTAPKMSGIRKGDTA